MATQGELFPHSHVFREIPMALTNLECKNAKCPRDEDSTGKVRKTPVGRKITPPDERKWERYADSGGLYLEVTPNESKRWFWKYRLDGKEKRLALGSYPEVDLASARQARDEARTAKKKGSDPVQAKQILKLKAKTPAGETFKTVALEWHALKSKGWGSHHTIRELRNINKDLIPYLGQRRISDIEPVELLAVVRKVNERGSTSVPHRVMSTANGIWKHAIHTGRANRNIATDLGEALETHHGKHYAAIIEPAPFAVLLRVIDGYQGSAVVRAALKLSPILFQRPGELRCATWDEFDLDTGTWTIPPNRMKRDKDGKLIGNPHLVPVPTQAVEILRDLQKHTGHGRLLFPGERSHDRPISDNTVNAALRTLGYSKDVQVAHGFRASARTMLEEQLGINKKFIEANLAHVVKETLGDTYNRSKFFKDRAVMIQIWADYLDKLRRGGDVVALPPRAAAN
jgi:integrase